jgi:hypothetical protein
MRIFPLVVLAFLFIQITAKSATCVSIGNGDWNNPSTWSCGAVPGCGDSIVILSAHTLTITNQQNYQNCNNPMQIAIYGNVLFNTGSKLNLPCNSKLYIFPGGSVAPGSGGGNSNLIEICNVSFWNASQGPYTGPGCMPPNSPTCGGVLPVGLINFIGYVCSNNHVCIEWKTSSERNNNYFELERSVNGLDFKNIARISSLANNGTSNSTLSYRTMDENPLPGISYYRLKQVDFNSSFTNSNLIAINTISQESLIYSIFPNPNSGEFTASLFGLKEKQEVKFTVKTIRGKVVQEKELYSFDTSLDFKFERESKLESGIYICTVLVAGSEYNLKIVVCP